MNYQKNINALSRIIIVLTFANLWLLLITDIRIPGFSLISFSILSLLFYFDKKKANIETKFIKTILVLGIICCIMGFVEIFWGDFNIPGIDTIITSIILFFIVLNEKTKNKKRIMLLIASIMVCLAIFFEIYNAIY